MVLSGALLYVPVFVTSPPPSYVAILLVGLWGGVAMDRAGTEQVGAGWVSEAGTQMLCV